MEIGGQTIRFLRDRDGFVSGEEMSRSLGITRSAVCKKVKALRRSGYLIEAVPSKGYKLLYCPDIPTKEEIRAVFRGDIIGREVMYYHRTVSTNDRALEIGAEAPEGTVVIADSQERGRGRFGRRWLSPPGVNLYFTVLLKPPFYPREAPVITLMASVAVASAIREYTGLDAFIKWPNDILVRDRKVGGILTEMKSDMDRIEFVAVGIGINVNMPLTALPKELRDVAGSLKSEKGESVNRVELLGIVLKRLEHWYRSILDGKKEEMLSEWRRLDSTAGRKVSVKMQDRIISGTARGIGEEGELIIRDFSGAVERVYAGEVAILRSAH